MIRFKLPDDLFDDPSDNLPDGWSRMVPDIAERRVVIVIGSGVSRHSSGSGGKRPPLWKEFLEQAIGECSDINDADRDIIKDAISKGDYLHACEWLKKELDSRWTSFLRDMFQKPKYEISDLHKAIHALDSRIVFSLNFDDIYERYVRHEERGTCTIKNYYDDDVEEFLRGSGRYIVKVHGFLDSVSKLIFTQKDYSQARVENSKFYQAFDAALLNYTFIFIGCGISDPDINLILENQNFRYQAQTPHFFITSKGMSSYYKHSLRENRNLKVLEYDPIDDDHIGLVNALNLLNKEVEYRRYDVEKYIQAK